MEKMKNESQSKEKIVVSLRNLCFKYFKGQDVFAGVNMDICAGEKVFVCGGRGSGKSTLMDILSGLEKGWLGKAEVLSKCPKDFGAVDARKHIVYLPEKPVFFENKSVRYNLDFACDVIGRERVTDEEFQNVLLDLGIMSDCKVKKLSKLQALKLEAIRAKLKKQIGLLLIDRLSDFWAEEDHCMAKQIFEDLMSVAETVLVTAKDKNDVDFFGGENAIIYYLRLGKAYLFTSFEELEKNPSEMSCLEFFHGFNTQKRVCVTCRSDQRTRLLFSRFESPKEYFENIDQQSKKRKKCSKSCEKRDQNGTNIDIVAKNEDIFTHDILIAIGGKVESKLMEFDPQDGDVFVCAGESLESCLVSSGSFEKAVEDANIVMFFALTGERVF